jgi:hypothetical protein
MIWILIALVAMFVVGVVAGLELADWLEERADRESREGVRDRGY